MTFLTPDHEAGWKCWCFPVVRYQTWKGEWRTVGVTDPIFNQVYEVLPTMVVHQDVRPMRG